MPAVTDDPRDGTGINGGLGVEPVDRDRLERLERRQRLLFEAVAIIAESKGATASALQELLAAD
jgi:hypothetical protein